MGFVAAEEPKKEIAKPKEPVIEEKKERSVQRSSRRSPSRSKSKERRHSSKKQDSQRYNSKKGRSVSRSHSRSSSGKRSRSSSGPRRHKSSRPDKDSRPSKDYKFRSEQRSDRYDKPTGKLIDEVEIGAVYDGQVTKVYDYGCFVSLDNFRRRTEGLVHISNIREVRISNPHDHVAKGDHVKVKVISTAGSKVSLSMKDVDQETGEIITRGELIKKEYNMGELKDSSYNPFKTGDEEEVRGFGRLTGVKTDDLPPKGAMLNDTSSRRAQKRVSSPELWELSR